MTSGTKICQNCNQTFPIAPDDFSFYEKMQVPPTTWCPQCRLIRRLAWRNERNFYHDICGLCNKKIISVYAPGHPFPVYCSECWWGDGWNPMDHGKPYDSSKPFFEQFHELFSKVPRPHLLATSTKNCSYCNYFADGKNCYLCFGSIAVEDCLYGSPYESKFCVDTYLARQCEYCYECIDCEKLSNCIYAQDCVSSFNLLYCFDCKNCQDCIGCAGLRNKKYCIFNVQYTREEFMAKRDAYLTRGAQGLTEIAGEFKKIKLAVPHRFASTLQCKDVSGDHIVQSKNAKNCFDVKRTEDSSYCIRMIDAKDAHDVNYCEYLELCYDYIGHWKVQRAKFSNTSGESSDITYCDFCTGSSNLFGCVGLRSKSYCILNRQYSPNEYDDLISKIKSQMSKMGDYGEFFPMALSPFAYNESVAMDYFPLSKEETISKGYRWRDPEPRHYEIKDDISACAHGGTCDHICTTAFRMIPAELEFYQRMKLSPPSLCPNCRHFERLALRNPFKLYSRQCAKCQKEIETSYAPNRPEIVYCESCYQQEVL